MLKRFKKLSIIEIGRPNTSNAVSVCLSCCGVSPLPAHPTAQCTLTHAQTPLKEKSFSEECVCIGLAREQPERKISARVTSFLLLI